MFVNPSIVTLLLCAFLCTGGARSQETWTLKTQTTMLGGSTLLVTWETSEIPNVTDTWIGLYRFGETPGWVGSTWWRYVCTSPPCLSSGLFNTSDTTDHSAFTVPTKESLPWIFYALTKDYKILGQSSLINIVHVISVDKTSFGTSEYITGTWNFGSRFTATSGDWIGLYPVGSTGASLWWMYVCSDSCKNFGKVSTEESGNSNPWKTPANRKGGKSNFADNGPWEFRYYQNDVLISVSRPMQFVPNVNCLPGNNPKSTITNVIVFATENHSFDSFFGSYCTAPAYSNPTCTIGPTCCEAPPECYAYVDLTDGENYVYDPCHTAECEDSEMNLNGTGNPAKCDKDACMGKYANGGTGSDSRNMAIANMEKTLPNYLDWITHGAMSDNFFQSSSGASSQNDVYLAYSNYLFLDNSVVPKSLYGVSCYEESSKMNYYDNTIADLLNFCGVTWAVAPEGYNLVKQGKSVCYPNSYDASDIGLAYSPATADTPGYWFDSDEILDKIKDGRGLPAVTFVRSLGAHSEHPGYGNSLKGSQDFIQPFIDAVSSSPVYSNSTLIFIVPDESGGFYDHICPPGISPVDNKPYGPRTPFIAVGYHTIPGKISHVQLETSSVVKFIEWNFLGGEGGQLEARDAIARNVGSLLDPSKTGVTVPS